MAEARAQFEVNVSGAVRLIQLALPHMRAQHSGTIAKAVTASRPKTRHAVGFAARPMIFLRGLLSDRACDGLMRRVTGISKVV